jgi:beta-N-acetylhexosaminidase
MMPSVRNWSILLLTAALAAGVVIYAGRLSMPTPEAKLIASVTDTELKKMIGQMIIIGFRGTQASPESEIVKAIKDLNLGGVFLSDYDIPSQSFSRNITGPEQVKELISDLKTYSPSLFVAVDAEGGKVNRLKPEYGFAAILSASEMGKDKTVAITSQEAKKLASELQEAGFNMNFAPVVDLNINPQNPIIGGLGRSFSADPENVINQAQAFIREHHLYGIITVPKHFPGHGSSTTDSHKGLVDVTSTYQDNELSPYLELEKENLLDAVMVGHIINKNIDKDLPATLSPAFLQTILHQQIGFKGVIISDDMQMAAIASQYTLKNSLVKAINAGCDIVAFSNNSQTIAYDKDLAYKVVDAIFEAVKEKQIPRQRIIESSERILKLKKQFGLI